MNEMLLDKFVDIFKNNILPLTIKGVEAGNKIFGAAIINKEDYSMVIAGANNETENPIWHGEIYTLKKFYELDNKIRPKEKNCIFLSSHEPCSLCLSAITFSGFNNFYYLFPYESTSDEFNYSSNPTYLSGSEIRVKGGIQSSNPVSYVSTVGLYGADNALLAVGKLSEPLRKDPTIEYTLRARLDY